MVKRKLRGKLIILLVAALWSQGAMAQFYNTGASPDHIRWRLYEDGARRVVAPDYFDQSARSILHYMDTVSHTIGYGLPINKLLTSPVVVHAENSASNGLSIWAPLRVEMSGMPAESGYGLSWLRQLSVHEFRHTAQYSALNRGLIKALRPVLGQQWMLLTSGLMPFWWIEGDATDAETQASAFGRALQPSFTMHYRAVGCDILRSTNPDTWFGGSYNKYVPSHYNLGYQMVAMANTIGGRYVWGDVIDYVVSKPYTIFPTEWAMRRRLGYSTEELFRSTFESLNDWWESLPERNDSARRVQQSATDSSPYTTLRWPLWVDGNTIVALKGDFDRPQRFVAVDVATGVERGIINPGTVSSRPAIVGDEIYWTERCQLSSFAQQMGSVMYKAPIDGGKAQRVLHKSIYSLYPTEWGGELAFVRYNFEGTYSIVCIEGEATLPCGVEVHGLAGDGEWLYLLTTSADGMAIERICPNDWQREVVRKASLTTLSDLRAQGGILYFGSIASGYDEVHALDPSTGREWRLTTSRYGSFDGYPSPDGKHIALAVYDAEGYHLAVDDVALQYEVEWSEVPENVVNPPRYEWSGMIDVGGVEFTPDDLEESKRSVSSKPYRKAAHLLDFHSWAPIYYRPEDIMAGSLGDVGFGVSATSQNILSSAFTTVGYRLGLDGSHKGVVNFKYVGLPVKLELGATVSSRSAGAAVAQGVLMKDGDYSSSYNDTEHIATPESTRSSWSLTGRAYAPIIVRNSYWTSVLTPSVEFSHSNLRLYNPTLHRYHTGVTGLAATLQWNSYTRMAVRDLQSRWGVAVIGGVGRMMGGFESPTTVGVFGRVYTPAFGANDGFTVKASWQGIEGNGPVGYALDFGWGHPRGFDHFVENYPYWPDDNVSLSVQYNTPLCYPDVGVSGVVLLKRVRLGLFADGMAWRGLNGLGRSAMGVMATCGGELWLDTSWFRLPSEGDLSIRLALYEDAIHWGVPVISGGVSVNF